MAEVEEEVELENKNTETTTTATTMMTPSFPMSRVKKIMKLDRDISKVNSEALFLVSLSAELFLRSLSDRSAAAAVAKKRKNIKIEHLRIAARDHRPTGDFLLDSLPSDVPAQQQKNKKKMKASEEKNEDDDIRPLPRGTQRIDRFFNKGTSSTAA